MTSEQVNVLVDAIISGYNTGLSRNNLDAIVTQYASGYDNSTAVDNINGDLGGESPINSNDVDIVAGIIDQLVGKGGDVGAAATAAETDRIGAEGSIKTSTTGIMGAIASLIIPTSQTVTTGQGGINVSAQAPGGNILAGLSSGFTAVIVTAGVALLVFLVIKLLDWFG